MEDKDLGRCSVEHSFSWLYISHVMHLAFLTICLQSDVLCIDFEMRYGIKSENKRTSGASITGVLAFSYLKAQLAVISTLNHLDYPTSTSSIQYA
jgi:hypothetical protein